MNIPFLNSAAAELGIVGFTISSLITLIFYLINSFNKREDKRTLSFQETISSIHTMHKNERSEWREDANIRQKQSNEAIKELSSAIHEMINSNASTIKLE
jgi:hypothetical protein